MGFIIVTELIELLTEDLLSMKGSFQRWPQWSHPHGSHTYVGFSFLECRLDLLTCFLWVEDRKSDGLSASRWSSLLLPSWLACFDEVDCPVGEPHLAENPTWRRTEGGLWLTAGEELNSANDHKVGLKANLSPVETWGDCSPNRHTLIIAWWETLKQGPPQSHIWVPDPQKLWDNRCCLKQLSSGVIY